MDWFVSIAMKCFWCALVIKEVHLSHHNRRQQHKPVRRSSTNTFGLDGPELVQTLCSTSTRYVACGLRQAAGGCISISPGISRRFECVL